MQKTTEWIREDANVVHVQISIATPKNGNVNFVTLYSLCNRTNFEILITSSTQSSTRSPPEQPLLYFANPHKCNPLHFPILCYVLWSLSLSVCRTKKGNPHAGTTNVLKRSTLRILNLARRYKMFNFAIRIHVVGGTCDTKANFNYSE